MINVMTASSRCSLRTSDPRLPLMATKAAIEFDNALQGKVVDFQSAKRLGIFLKESFASPIGAGAEAFGLDLTTVDIVGQAINDSKWRGGIKTVGDVVERASEIAGNLDCVPENEDQAGLEQLRVFCIALCNSLVGYRESLQDYRPSSPYRR